MRSASAGMIAHLDQSSTTLTWCWKAVRRDAQIFGFTTHDKDLVINGVTYKASTGMTASAAQAKVGMAVDNMEITGFLGGPDVTAADMRAGVWDGCEITVYMVNWADVTQSMPVQGGKVGNISMHDEIYVAEMLSLTSALQSTVGRVCTKRCDADLGDTRCGINLAAWTVTGTVTSVVDNQTFDGTFLPAVAGGLITWTSGLNNTQSMEVSTLGASTIGLILPMDYNVAVGDAYSISAGCDKNLSTCLNAFSNVLNFRGFPHIPGPDKVLAYPDAT